MGKGFNNYMCKKFFHPASADNLKRVWIAQKKADAEKKKQDDLRTQYDREQELYNNKALLSKESKEKMELNFMYEPPPGVKKIGEGDKEEGEPEYKFEWQRTWGHAPKESYLEKGDDFVEQPFGIQVCQAKCIKCGKYGHMNTDKRCPLYGKAVDSDAPIQDKDQTKLIEEMKADGLAMRYSSWELNQGHGPNHTIVTDRDEKPLIDRAELLKTMSKEEKKALLKKLKKMEEGKKEKRKKEKKSKKSKKSKKKKDKRRSSSSSSFSSEAEEDKHDRRRDDTSDPVASGSSSSRRSDDNDRRNRDRHETVSRRDRSRSREIVSRRDRSRSRETAPRRDRSRSREERNRRRRSGSRERRRGRSASRDRDDKRRRRDRS